MTDPATERFIALMNERTPAPPPAPPAALLGGNGHHAYVDTVIGGVANAPEGQRNDTLNAAAYTLSRIVAAGQLDEQSCVDRLTQAGMQAGLGGAEIERTIRSGMDSGRQRPRQLDEHTLPTLTVIGPTTPAPTKNASARTWQRVDTEDVLTGTYDPPRPTVGGRADGSGLFYPGRLHTVASESEGGKTWLALHAARQQIDAGHGVVYLDFEDDKAGVIGRMLALGGDPQRIRDHFAYIRPEDSIDALGNRQDLTEVLADLKPALAVLDGVTEAMVMHGLEMKDNTDVARFGQLLPRWLASTGPACVALDHVVKDRDNRGRYAIGGVHKLNGVNGAAYILDNRVPFGIGRTGRSTVLVAKDRPGQIRQHCLPGAERRHWFADLVVVSHDERVVEVDLAVPAADSEQFRPTVLMARIAAALTEHGDLSGRKIELAVIGKSAGIRDALGFLQLDGYVSDASPHRLLKPYPSGTETR